MKGLHLGVDEQSLSYLFYNPKTRRGTNEDLSESMHQFVKLTRFKISWMNLIHIPDEFGVQDIPTVQSPTPFRPTVTTMRVAPTIQHPEQVEHNEPTKFRSPSHHV